MTARGPMATRGGKATIGVTVLVAKRKNRSISDEVPSTK